MVTLVAWIAVTLVLAAYASGRRRLYDWANLLLGPLVALPAILMNAAPSAAISLAFGAIGGWRILRARTPIKVKVDPDSGANTPDSGHKRQNVKDSKGL